MTLFVPLAGETVHKLTTLFLVKTHSPVKGVGWEIGGIDPKNSDSQPNTFETALWIKIGLHRVDQNTLGSFSRNTLPFKPLYNSWAGKRAGDLD